MWNSEADKTTVSHSYSLWISIKSLECKKIISQTSLSGFVSRLRDYVPDISVSAPFKHALTTGYRWDGVEDSGAGVNTLAIRIHARCRMYHGIGKDPNKCLLI